MDRIKVEGYKSIKSLDIELLSINILIGANGSGKSNFLSFFEFLNNIYNRNLREYVALRGGVDKFLHKGSKVTEEISAKIWLKLNAYSFTLKRGEETFIFSKEGLWYEHNPFMPNSLDIASFSTESRLRYKDTVRAKYVKNYLEAIQKYHFHDTGQNSPFNTESNVENDRFFLYEKGQNLAAFLLGVYTENLAAYNLIVKTIQAIAPYFLDFVFKPENNNIKLRWQSKHSSTIYGATDLSDGTIRFIALTTLFLQPTLPQTIMIDEPELGLHPVAISRLGIRRMMDKSPRFNQWLNTLISLSN